MDPAAWSGVPDICGSCIAWKPVDPRPGDEVAKGECKLRPELKLVAASLKKCTIYKPRGTFRYDPNRAPPGSTRKRASTLRVLRRGADGEMVAAKAPPRSAAPEILRREKDIEVEWERDEVIPGLDDVAVGGDRGPRPEAPVRTAPKAVDLGGGEDSSAVRATIVDLLRKEHGKSPREIHSKFRGGFVVAKTERRTVQMPAERFFSMVDRYRASLDAMEKKIEAIAELSGEKEDLVGQLRRMQGSFTTFNVMFQDRDDYFSGKE